MNSPSSVFPSDIITKVRGYYANTAMDIIEVSVSLKQPARCKPATNSITC